MSTEKLQAQSLLDEAVQKVDDQPKRARKGCRRGCLIFVLIAAFPVYWFGCHTTSLRVSYETTRALGPMMSDGKRIDYFRAYEELHYPPEMKTDDNGYRVIVRALGCPIRDSRLQFNPTTGEEESIPVDGELLRRQVYEKLGLDPNVPPMLNLKPEEWSASNYIWQDSKNRNEEPQARDFGVIAGKPWTLEKYPFMQGWLEKANPALDVIGEAVRKPAFKVPYAREHEDEAVMESLLNLQEVQTMRDWARSLQCRTRYRLGTGDIDGATYDIITCHLLARHVGKQGTLVMYLVGIAIEGVARSLGIAENPDFPPTKEQIEHLHAELAELPPRCTMNEAVESERFFSLRTMQDQYWGKDAGPFPLPVAFYPILKWSVDINIILARFNDIFDSLRDQTRLVDEIDEALRKPQHWPLRLPTVRSRSLLMADTLSSLFIPAMQAGREAYRRIECAENMQTLTLALMLYEKEHGKLPNGDWREAIRPYLGDDSENIFRCPSCSMPEGYTTYALIDHATPQVDTPGTPSPARELTNKILIVEAFPAMKLGEGTGRITPEQAQNWVKGHTDSITGTEIGVGSMHAGVFNAGYRNGSVGAVSAKMLMGEEK